MTRPTSDKIREALFNILGQTFEGGAVLDLYAGTGALALEALSRGCERAVLVDADRFAIDAIRENATLLRLEQRVEIVQGRVEEVVPRRGDGEFLLAFIDPPTSSGRTARWRWSGGCSGRGGAWWRTCEDQTTRRSLLRAGAARSAQLR